METVLIRADQVTADDVIVIAWFQYRVTDVVVSSHGMRGITLDCGYSECLGASDMVRVKATSRCVVTGDVDCKSRRCELHYMGAPLRLAREVTRRLPDREGNGTSYVWSRTFGGVKFWFTFVVMPNGERRYFVERYNGYGDTGTPESRATGMRFGCAWTPVHNITVYPVRDRVTA